MATQQTTVPRPATLAPPAVGRARAAAGAVLARHWPIVVLLLAGGLVRALAMLAYPPALMFPDSYGYVAAAFSGELPSVHPIGYSLLIWLLTKPGRSLAELVAFQHLAVLACGASIYAALI